jgi:hypothetical protein
LQRVSQVRPNYFTAVDLSRPFDRKRRFDLVMSWPPYWIDLFANLGYAKLDFIRGRIWNEQLVSPW